MVEVKIRLDLLNDSQYRRLVDYLDGQIEDRPDGADSEGIPTRQRINYMKIESIEEVKGTPPKYKGIEISFSVESSLGSKRDGEGFEGLAKLLAQL